MPEQINPNGSLFGGVMMSWMDKVAYMAAQLHSGRPHTVTVCIDQIEFLSPVKSGDHVILTAQVDFAGRSSMEIKVEAEREDPFSLLRSLVATANLTFVALDESGRPAPVPELDPKTPEECARFRQIQEKVRLRKSENKKALNADIYQLR